MHLVTKNDKARVVRIIEESFKGNPSVTWVVKDDHKKDQRLKALAEYLFDVGFAKKGVYLSTDNNATAIIFRFNNKLNKLVEKYHEARLLIRAIGIKKMFKILHRQAYLKSQKPASGEYLYMWVFGASDEGRGQGGALELKEGIFQLSRDVKLPIYIETTVAQNRMVYERYGFSVYHSWPVPHQGITVWFMKWDPEIEGKIVRA